MSGWSHRPIRTLVNSSAKTQAAVNSGNPWNLNLDQIESHSGRVLEKVYVSKECLGPSTYPFEPRTVLYSKLRPYLNKVVVADEAGFATTELVPLRCKSEEVHPEYLAYFLRSNGFLRFADTVVAGAKMPRMVMSEFWEFPVPLPPLSEQRRIAAILDQADALRAKRREALAQLDSLTQSNFIEMFGDPIDNPKGWPKAKLGQIVRVRRGGSPRPIENYLGGAINWIKIGDATQGDDTYISHCKEKITEDGLQKTVFLKRGSLIFANCGVSLGFARILEIEGCIHDGWLSFDEFDENLLDRIFFLKALNSVTERFRAMAPAGTQPNLNTSIMKQFLMILPPIELQRRFSEQLKSVQKLIAIQKAAAAELDSLFASLQHRAFAGEL